MRYPASAFTGVDPRTQLDGFLEEAIPDHAPGLEKMLEAFTAYPSSMWMGMIMSNGRDRAPYREILRVTRETLEVAVSPALTEALLAGDQSLEAAGIVIRNPRVPISKALTASQDAVLAYLATRHVELVQYFGEIVAKVVMETIAYAVRRHKMTIGDAVLLLQNVISLDAQQARAVTRAYVRDLELGMNATHAEMRMLERTRKGREERAKRVLDYELSRAWNVGTLEGVRERRLVGQVDPMVVKVWLTVGDDNVCPVCAPLHLQAMDPEYSFDNKKAAREILDGLDPAADRDTLQIDVDKDVRVRALHDTKVQIITMSPPAHVRCRCVLAYKRRPTPRRRTRRAFTRGYV